MSNFREQSKGNWSGQNTVENINAGSFQRIADAVEKMALRHDELVRAKEISETGRNYWQNRALKLERVVRGLRSYIKRMKKQ